MLSNEKRLFSAHISEVNCLCSRSSIRKVVSAHCAESQVCCTDNSDFCLSGQVQNSSAVGNQFQRAKLLLPRAHVSAQALSLNGTDALTLPPSHQRKFDNQDLSSNQDTQHCSITSNTAFCSVFTFSLKIHSAS